jgi:ubiquinone/menaquinone biosynthesis C-methylase UbiE
MILKKLKNLLGVSQSSVSAEEVLSGYDQVCKLYASVPPLSHWRAWEYAAYQKFQIKGRILDLGCGDGKYFRLLWPSADNVVGVDMEPNVAELGRKSGVYRNVHITTANQVPELSESFDCVFANCSLEHMDDLNGVLSEIYRCLKPGGTLLCSVVTNRFVEWCVLPYIVAKAGFEDVANKLLNDFLEYHHLANPLSVEDWKNRFQVSGLYVESHIPILPKNNSGIFLLMDNLWHISKADGGEIGDIVHPFLTANSKFPTGFRDILSGILKMEQDWTDCSGAVFKLRKP